MGSRIMTAAAFGVALLIGSGLVEAAQSGGVPVRIPTGPNPDCINGTTDRIWITLYRAIVTKKGHFFSTERRAEVIMNVHVSSDPEQTPPKTYPLSATVDIDGEKNGQVSLPIEYTLVNGLILKQKSVSYTGFGIDATLVNVRDLNAVGNALLALQTAMGSNKLPIPSSPYTQAAGYLMQVANDAIDRDIKSKNANDKVLTESLTLNIDPTGTCNDGGPNGAGFERTGVKAILKAEGSPGPGYVPIDNTRQYCFSADVAPVFLLKTAPKRDGVDCSDASYESQYKDVSNDYVAFLLQKRPAPPPATGNLGRSPDELRIYRESVEDAVKKSKGWCKALGWNKKLPCPGAR